MTILSNYLIIYLFGLAGVLLLLFGRVALLPGRRLATAQRRNLSGDRSPGTAHYGNQATR